MRAAACEDSSIHPSVHPLDISRGWTAPTFTGATNDDVSGALKSCTAGYPRLSPSLRPLVEVPGDQASSAWLQIVVAGICEEDWRRDRHPALLRSALQGC